MKKKAFKKKFSLFRILLSLVVILIFFLVVLILMQQNFFKGVANLFSDPELVVIEDECGFVPGGLVHKIKTDGECKISCQNTCVIKDSNYYSFDFKENLNDCNVCNCYCKESVR